MSISIYVYIYIIIVGQYPPQIFADSNSETIAHLATDRGAKMLVSWRFCVFCFFLNEDRSYPILV